MPFGRAWFGWGDGWGEASAEALAEVGAEGGLDGVIRMLGAGLAMVCLTVIPMEDMDLAMVQRSPMGITHGKGV